MARIYLPSHVQAVHCDPIVLHRSADGQSYRFPGRSDAPAPAGFERLELQPREARKELEKINRLERGKIEAVTESESAFLHYLEEKNRPELRQAMQRMSPAYRAFAELAIAYNNSRRPRTQDPNLHCEVLEYDSSNREAWADRDRNGRARR